MEPDHLSVYQLTIEPGTVFARRQLAGRLSGLPNDDDSGDMYMITNDILGEAGLSAYEVSNHARTGQPCRHNLTYWRAGDWLGIGPGAHGRFRKHHMRCATVGFIDPSDWLSAVERTGSGMRTRDASPHGAHGEEYLLTGMRLSEGIDLRRLRLFGLLLSSDAIDALETEALIRRDGECIRPNIRGLALADSVIAYLAASARPVSESVSQSWSRSASVR